MTHPVFLQLLENGYTLHLLRFAFISIVTLNDLLLVAGALTNFNTLMNFSANMSGLACFLFWIEIVFAFESETESESEFAFQSESKFKFHFESKPGSEQL